MIETRSSLLLRIRDPGDARAWGDFVRLYAPLLYSYGRKNGLQDADAADLTQDALRIVLRTAPGFEYDRDRGSFRGWLLTVARNELRRAESRRRAGPAGTGDPEAHRRLADVPDRTAADDEWESDYRAHLFRWATDRVKPEFRRVTWDAFWRTAVAGDDVATVAAELGLTAGAVYIARCRVTARIRAAAAAYEEGRL